jgi:TFIIF-interacting CTD phosphatase-like protein
MHRLQTKESKKRKKEQESNGVSCPSATGQHLFWQLSGNPKTISHQFKSSKTPLLDYLFSQTFYKSSPTYTNPFE